MKTFKFLFFAFILTEGIMLTFQGCKKENAENLNSNSNRVTLDYAKQIALNFAKVDAIIRDS